MRARVGDVELEYETAGDPSSQPLLLINGLGSQMIAWPPGLIQRLVDLGFYVIRFDNRDVGLSTWFDDRGQYSLDDMAADAAGLLEQLGIERAHVVGASMGGMIAQLVAINHQERVLSLTSIMSHLGGADAVPSRPEAAGIFARPVPEDRERMLEAGLEAARILAGGNPIAEEQVRQNLEAAYDRAFHPAGTARQLAAVVAAPSRRAALAKVRVPVLVVHGLDDPRIVPENGRRTAAAIPHARLLEITGMGHNYAEHALEAIAGAVSDLAEAAAKQRIST